MEITDEFFFEEWQLRGTAHPIKHVFIAKKNGRSTVLDGLAGLSKSEQGEIRSIIKKMVSVEGFKSPKVRWRLKKYSYGEIKPKGKRVFFFQKFGNNIILFDYKEKKKGSLGDKVYKALDKEREEYEREFEKFNK